MKKYLSLALVAVFIIVVAFVWTRRTQPVPEVSPSPEVSASSPSTSRTMYPLNLTYEVDGEMIRLYDGKASTPAGAGEMVTESFGTPIFGDIGVGKGSGVLFLAQETPGTGVFFYVVATYPDGAGSYKGTNAVFIGDRIAPQTIRIVNGAAEVNYAVRKDNEPMSAEPSVAVTKYFIIKNGKLQEK